MTKPKKQPNKHKVTSPFAVGDRVQSKNATLSTLTLGTLVRKRVGFRQWEVQWDDALLTMWEWEHNLMLIEKPKRGKKK